MSAFQDRNVETIDLTMDDELDIIAASPVVHNTSSRNDDRVLRTRHSLGNTVANPPKRKRARTLSESTIENHEYLATGKKQKMEDKKAVCLLSLTRRDKNLKTYLFLRTRSSSVHSELLWMRQDGVGYIVTVTSSNLFFLPPASYSVILPRSWKSQRT